MKNIIIAFVVAVAVLSVTPGFAQQAPKAPTPQEIKKMSTTTAVLDTNSARSP
jgi:hypothetical protein